VIDADAVAIDASGNAWFADAYVAPALSKFSSGGTPIPLTSAIATGGGLAAPGPYVIAIDASGNVWAACSSSLAEFTNSGTAISTSAGFPGGGLANPKGIAIDGAGNVWLANYNSGGVSEFSKAGVAITPAPSGYNAAGVLSGAYGVAIDSSGDVWVASADTHSLDELVGTGTPTINLLSVAVKNNTIATAP